MMKLNMFFAVLGLASVLWGAQSVQAKEGGLWSEPVRGSWVAQDGKGLALWNADIVVDEQAYSCVKQAAKFLAQDLEKITGKRPAIVSRVGKKPSIRLATVDASETPAEFNALSGKWEAYRIKTTDEGIWLVGSNPRGTAFAVYTLAERLGVDPLYIWTGYAPEQHEKLTVKPVNFEAGEPTFKFRGMFHDDEDALIDYRPTQAAALMWEFARRRPNKKGRHNALVHRAMEKLDALEKEIKAAEVPPFENWYKPTWIRPPDLVPNVHYSHDRLKTFISEYNLSKTKWTK